MKKKFKMQSTHFLAIISIIISIFSISLIIFYNEYFRSKYVEEQEKINFKNEVYQIAKKLISCLGEEKEGIFYINKSKLDEFSKLYEEIEPRCAIADSFDYTVKVIQLEKEIQNYPPLEYKKTGGIAEEILRETNRKSVIFVLDVSGSMSIADTPPCDGYEYNSHSNSRICCLKKFTIYFLDNYGKETRMGLNIFGAGSCDVAWVIDPYKNVSEILDNVKKRVLNFIPQDATPLLRGLLYAVEKAEENSYIVLLTDGGENCGGVSLMNIIDEVKMKNITLLSIGFGKDASVSFLKMLYEKVGGKVFEAKNCEELVSERLRYEEKVLKLEKKEWIMGIKSIGPKIYYEIAISLPMLIKYNETHIIDGILTIIAYKGFLENFYGFLDSLCNKEVKELELSKKFYFDYDVKVFKDKVCSEDVCKRLICNYDIEEKEFKKGENIINIRIYDGKLLFS